jgi:hypothetical protein
MRQVPQEEFTIEALTHKKWIEPVMSNNEGNLGLSLSRTQD